MTSRIITGDALIEMAKMEAESVDLILTDPPYFLPAVHYNVRSGSARSLSDLSMLSYFYCAVFKEIHRVLKPTGFLLMFCDGQSYPVFYAISYQMFKAVRPLIWDKGTSINGYGWRHQHELILFGTSVESPSIKTGDGDILRFRAVPIKERLHLAEKPLPLLRKLITKLMPEGGMLCDPFCGSGSVVLAAQQLHYEAIGIELSPAYAEMARRRIENDAPLLNKVETK